MNEKQRFRLGLDIGSTTAKFALINSKNDLIFSDYLRHNTGVTETVIRLLNSIKEKFGDIILKVRFTGSAGMGIAERTKLPFIQEVVAAGKLIKAKYPSVKTLIDIGGEDSKMIFFADGKPPDFRMNGSCAGGTGAFIDQMATLMNIPVEKFNELAQKSKKRYSIASRCGVFAKTDVQNLLARKVNPEDIARSVFQAVATQVIQTLSRGYDVLAKLMLIGGPFTFLPELRKTFLKVLKFNEDDVVMPEKPAIIPAIGSAMIPDNKATSIHISKLIALVKETEKNNFSLKNRLQPLFQNKEEFNKWESLRVTKPVKKISLEKYTGRDLFMGIDSGSTTTKIVIIGENTELIYSYYSNNDGNSIAAVKTGLKTFYQNPNAKDFPIVYSAVTGYGEDLIKAAFNINVGIVETIAHFRGAKHFEPNTSFIIDIGGQDMKAIFVKSGVVNRIELNESCSAGCGSFIETFGKSLGHSAPAFAKLATDSENPYDLGTRCTVFMNSKVKQALKENASISDISAGLSISVIKNALYKVLKLHNTAELGNHVVVQGGAFKNPAVHKAMEDHLGMKVTISNIPELMGAFGAALVAKEQFLHENNPETLSTQSNDEIGVEEFSQPT